MTLPLAHLRRLAGVLREEAPLAPYTTLKIGGPAEALFAPADLDACRDAVRIARAAGSPVWFLGGGTNTLVADTGVRGLVVRLSAVAFTGVASEGEDLRAGAGAALAQLVHEGARRGSAALAALAGIPGTVGGAVAMNAGGRFGEIAQAVRAVRLLCPDGEIRDAERTAIPFAYRRADLAGGLVLSALFACGGGDPARARETLAAVMAHKKTTQPLHEKSAGCAFKNPGQGLPPASRLIDEAGLKGSRCGAIVVSPCHANFLVNEGGGRADDVLRLLALIREAVRARTGVMLEPEIQMWGFA